MKQTILYGLVGAAISSIASAAATPSLKQRASSTLTPITTSGNAFYNGTDRFYIRGVDYQPGGGTGVESDPIADASACKRDVAYFQQLNINTIRVYAVDNTANHDECMEALAAAGIYLVLDTDTSKYSLNRDDPKISYNSVYLQSVFATIDAFANYTNVLGFLSGNEVINNVNTTADAPYVKAVVRDMKQYIGARGYRAIPVGYAAADVSENQQLLGEYLNCGTDDERSDFYAINDYSWCEPSSFTTSGWDTLVANYTGFGIPVFMSEEGCITNGRNFEEVSALYNTEMTSVFSGALMYEYSEEGNGYGLVTISGNSVSPNAQFTALQNAYASQANPTGNGGATATTASSTCPTENANWQVSGDTLPAIPSAALALDKTGAGAGPGLSGPGSQSSGDSENESQGTATPGSGTVSATYGSTSGGPTSTGTSKKSDAMRPAPIDIKAFSIVGVVILGMISGMAVL